jgi:hypothetical protein
MNRIRRAAGTCLVGVTLLAGCQTSDCAGGRCGGHGLFGRLSSRSRAVVVDAPPCCEAPCGDGPLLGDPGACCPSPAVAPFAPGPGAAPAVVPAPANGQALPPLAPAPRLVPQPQAQPTPADPTSATKAVAR